LRAQLEYWRTKNDAFTGRVVHISAFRDGEKLVGRVAWSATADGSMPRLDAVVMPHALMRARWIFERHGLERMTVFLPEGETWDSQWGDLRDIPDPVVATSQPPQQQRFLGRIRR
jgi:hypothetical protein